MDVLNIQKELEAFLQKNPHLLEYQQKLNTKLESVRSKCEPIEIFKQDNIPNQIIDVKSLNLNESANKIINVRHLSFKQYQLNKDAFIQFQQTLRDHQQGATISLQNLKIGQINIPTGTGKTYIQKYIHINDMINKTENNQTGIYVIAAHRLVLCTQLFDEIIDLLIKCGIRCDFLYVGSENYNFTQLNNKYKAYGFPNFNVNVKRTTRSQEILEMAESAKRNNHHLLIVSTYHSFGRLRKLPKIDICTFDEAHTTVANKLHTNIELVHPIINKKFFFTATRKVIGKTEGQNNFNFYGPISYEMSARQAIEASEIVSPRIHLIDFKNSLDSKNSGDSKKHNFNLLIRTILESYVEHDHKIKQHSTDPNKIAAKMLVTNSGLDEIQNIVSSPEFIVGCISKDIKLFAFSSKNKYHYIKDGQLRNCSSRREILEAMYKLTDTDRAILFHYDILTEGIDLPAITGTLLLRELGITKIIQNIGRACRLMGIDRYNIYSGMIPLENKERYMVKPFSWVILPIYQNLGWGQAQRVVEDLRQEYDIMIDHVEISDKSTSSKIVPLEPVTENKSIKYGYTRELEHMFEPTYLDELNQEFLAAMNQEKYLREYIERNAHNA